MKRNIKWGAILILTGIAFQLHELGIVKEISSYWPLLLIVFGVTMLFEKQKEEEQK